MPSPKLRLIAAALACLPVFGQTAPHISSVVKSADFQSGIALDSFGTIFGTGLSDAVHQATVYPFPTSLGPTQVAFCLDSATIPGGKMTQIDSSRCQYLSLVYVSPAQINFIVPAKLMILPEPVPGASFAPGYIAAVVSVNGVLDDATTGGTNSAQAQRLFSSPLISPAIFFEGYDCSIDPMMVSDQGVKCGLSSVATTYSIARGAITDLSGTLITSSNPAHLDQNLILWATGYGPNVPKSTNSNIMLAAQIALGIPIYPYIVNGLTLTDYVCCGTAFATISYAAETSYSPGLDQINFQISSNIGAAGPGGYPPAYPCGSYGLEFLATLADNTVLIPIAVRNGDIAGCAP
jgi:uncharacterized protein (TIGR03437 family)